MSGNICEWGDTVDSYFVCLQWGLLLVKALVMIYPTDENGWLKKGLLATDGISYLLFVGKRISQSPIAK